MMMMMMMKKKKLGGVKSSSSCCFMIVMMVLLELVQLQVASSRSALYYHHYYYNVVNFGAKGDGKTDSTKGFLKAWSYACNSMREGPAVYVPSGTYLVGAIRFSGPCKSKVTFRIDGKIVAPSNYWSLGTSGYWVLFYKLNSLAIYGGSFDARGAAFWACRLSNSNNNCPPGARSISFVACSNVVVRGLRSMNSQIFHIAIYQCHGIVLRSLLISAPTSSLNTDGVHIQSSSGITISRTSIMTGDDCIAVGPGSRNIWVENIWCGPGHGISIGSLAEHAHEDGVQNVTVTGAFLTGTTNGVRIKSWARPSTGFAEDIVFRDIVMKNSYNPIIIDQAYCPTAHNCPNHNSGVKISGVTYKNIRGTSASQTAINFMCSQSNPCTDLTLQDIRLTYNDPNNGGTATSSCTDAHGTTQGVVIPTACF